VRTRSRHAATPVSSRESDYALMRASHWLVAIGLLAFTTGLVAGSLGAGSPETWLSVYSGAAWLLYVCIYCWMKADARERSHEPPPGATPLIPVLLPIAIPYYLVWTRQRWRKLSSLGLLSLYAVMLMLCAAAGEWISGSFVS
jgi:hypothetical protein